MQLDNLWKKLAPVEGTLSTLKSDLSEGKVPELPFYIVNQKEAKEKISNKLTELDGKKMKTSIVIGHYGNGKTNLLKYLKLYFQRIENIHFIYSRVDIEQPDVILYLLKLIQDLYTDELINAVISLQQRKIEPNNLIAQGDDTFGAIKEYTRKLFSETDKDNLKKIIYLGTGRLYTKSHFSEFGLQQLQNFNRREILVLFLNILSEVRQFLIFGLDEIEKILEKSKARFNLFLTSYRELIDLFNQINGHYLISCFTDASGTSELEIANPAFYSRVKGDIINLAQLTNDEDIKELILYLDELFDTKRSRELAKIVTQIKKKNISGNRDLIRNLIQILLSENEIIPFAEILKNFDLQEIFNETKEALENEGNLKSLHQKFFDPLEYYLEDNNRLSPHNILDRRRNQAFIDENLERIYLFVFNENTDIDNLNRKANELTLNYRFPIIIFSPEKLELSNSAIKIDGGNEFTIINYEPEELFILLNMYRDNFENQENIGTAIGQYTNRNL